MTSNLDGLNEVSEAANGQCEGTSERALYDRVRARARHIRFLQKQLKDQPAYIEYLKSGKRPDKDQDTPSVRTRIVIPSFEERSKSDLQAELESQTAILQTLERELEPGRAIINDLKRQTSSSQRSPKASVVFRVRDGAGGINGYVTIEDPEALIKSLLEELKDQQEYVECLKSGEMRDMAPVASALEARFVIPSFEEMKTLDGPSRCDCQSSIINALLNEVDVWWEEIRKLELQNDCGSSQSPVDASFVTSACGKVLEQLEACDHTRRSQVEAIEQEADPMKKIRDLVEFLVDYSGSLVSKREDS
jgi:hypothetical protein